MIIKSIGIDSRSLSSVEHCTDAPICVISGRHAHAVADLIRTLLAHPDSTIHPDSLDGGVCAVYGIVELGGRDYSVCYLTEPDDPCGRLGVSPLECGGRISALCTYSYARTLGQLAAGGDNVTLISARAHSPAASRVRTLTRLRQLVNSQSLTSDDPRPLFFYLSDDSGVTAQDVSRVLGMTSVGKRQIFVAITDTQEHAPPLAIERIYPKQEAKS